ncbi:hypothetical protein ColLi_11584 [Colletotrichum liriopes]|uniref:Uncharacterized protein n=1 Tax=Colletotrichum liriopes TaxID=708192 RepID=A0AA37GYI9_9PEZI|nr:hypothetical protein ColLi_11584 [Colletotrichum liriopes]
MESLAALLYLILIEETSLILYHSQHRLIMASSTWLDMIVAGVLGNQVQSPLSAESLWQPIFPHVAVFAQLVSTFCLLTYTVLIRPWRQPATQIVRPFGRGRLFEISHIYIALVWSAYSPDSPNLHRGVLRSGLVLLQQQTESQVQTHITLIFSASCIGALSSILGLLLGQPSTVRGVYHLLSSLTWTFFNSSLPLSSLPLNWLFPWVLAATFLLDVFHASPSSRPKGTTVSSISTQSSLFEKLSYSWLGRIIEVQDVVRLDDLPEIPALAPSEEYEARLVEAAGSSPENAATHLYWRFIMREHRRQLVVSTLLRLACDASLFATPGSSSGC